MLQKVPGTKTWIDLNAISYIEIDEHNTNLNVYVHGNSISAVSIHLESIKQERDLKSFFGVKD